ncbi:hypothetical protein [Pelagibacterium halotolerans]|uniref:hypothetical protein n=1 Tax=Pelagibacterium halotolerans TaxID=531813 RepID=UPI0038512971
MYDWIALYVHAGRMQRRRSRDRFADPLQAPEWQGLLWMILWQKHWCEWRERRSASAEQEECLEDAVVSRD